MKPPAPFQIGDRVVMEVPNFRGGPAIVIGGSSGCRNCVRLRRIGIKARPKLSM